MREGDALVAADGTRYPIDRGVPRFLANPPLESVEEQARLEAMTDRARAVGWRETVEETFTDDELRYVTSTRRAAYVHLLPLDARSAVLEVGCSLGQGTSALARRAGTVHAVEVVPGQAAFAVERLRQEGLTNARVCCGGDDCRLPFADGSFDVAVLNLVLEWCGQREAGHFVDAQRRLLAEAARTLSPGGTIYVATKNRFGLPYLLGLPDEHAFELRFGSALPRALLRRALAAMGHRRPRGVLHSLGGLSRLLEEAGFERLQAYWAAPDARYPDRYVPADAASVRASRASLAGASLGMTRRVRLVLPWIPAALVKHVTPSLVLTALRAGAASEGVRRRAA